MSARFLPVDFVRLRKEKGFLVSRPLRSSASRPVGFRSSRRLRRFSSRTLPFGRPPSRCEASFRLPAGFLARLQRFAVSVLRRSRSYACGVRPFRPLVLSSSFSFPCRRLVAVLPLSRLVLVSSVIRRRSYARSPSAVASPFPRAFICETARFRRLRVRPCFRFQPSAVRSLAVRSIPSPRHWLVGSWFVLVPVGHMTAGLPSFPFSVVPVRSLRAWVSLRLPARAVRWPFPCEKSVGLASARSPCERGFRRRFVIASSLPRRSLVRRSASGRLPARSLSDSALVASSLSLSLSLVRFFAPFSGFSPFGGVFPVRFPFVRNRRENAGVRRMLARPARSPSAFPRSLARRSSLPCVQARAGFVRFLARRSLPCRRRSPLGSRSVLRACPPCRRPCLVPARSPLARVRALCLSARRWLAFPLFPADFALVAVPVLSLAFRRFVRFRPRFPLRTVRRSPVVRRCLRSLPCGGHLRFRFQPSAGFALRASVSAVVASSFPCGHMTASVRSARRRRSARRSLVAVSLVVRAGFRPVFGFCPLSRPFPRLSAFRSDFVGKRESSFRVSLARVALALRSRLVRREVRRRFPCGGHLRFRPRSLRAWVSFPFVPVIALSYSLVFSSISLSASFSVLFPAFRFPARFRRRFPCRSSGFRLVPARFVCE